MSTLIDARAVGKRYGRTRALDRVSFKVKKGQIIGLLGRNGAGKTSLLKVLLGLAPYEGDLSVLGMQPRQDRTALMQRMCFIADVAILPKWLRVKDAINFIEGVHPKFNRDKALMFMERTNVPLNKKVRHLSKGMVTQLHLALVMAIDVDILVLDEPTLGLDILYRKTFYQNLLNDYFTEERTIIVATHQVEEIEGLLTDVMILDKGQLILNHPMSELFDQFVVLTVRADQAEAVRKLKPLLEQPQIGQVRFLFEQPNKTQLEALGTLSNPSVSDIFVAKVGAVS